MSDRLSKENADLRKRLRAFVTQANENQSKLQRFQELQLRLMTATSLADVLETILYAYRREFEHDAVTLLLADENYEIRRILKTLDWDRHEHPNLLFVENIEALQQAFSADLSPRLGPCDQTCNLLFFPQHNRGYGSIAILPLIRQQTLIGALSLGSHDASRFVAGSATDFLSSLAAVLAICLENALNHERLKLLGILDPLTGVHNRRYFEQRLKEECDRATRLEQPLSCLYFDLDHFKAINDEHGHATGDTVLRHVSRQIKKFMRASDVMARLGGEEFSALLINTTNETAVEIAERIRQQICAEPFSMAGNIKLNITISIGCATLDSDCQLNPEQTGVQLVKAADQALYQAKHEGRNRVVCAESLLRLDEQSA
jgi:diguanylate cyclase (GGDEF)-like protein